MPIAVLTDLFAEEEFEQAIMAGNPAAAAALAIERLRQAGFEIKPIEEGSR